MDNALIVLNQTLIMCVLMAIGFWLFRKGIITKQGSKEIGGMLLHVVIPIIIVKSFAIEFSVEKAKMLTVSLLVGLLVLLISMAIAHLLLKKDGIENFSAAFSNAGFIGIPLVQAVLGGEAVFYIAGLIAMLNILQWTYGVYVISKDKSTIAINKLVKNPVIIAFIIGLIVFFLPISLPHTITSVMESIGGLNTPLAMVILGVYLAQADLGEMFMNASLYKVAMIRLVLIPLVILGVLTLLPKAFADCTLAILIAAAAPAGANVAIYAQQYNSNYTKAVMIVCLTTLLSVITLPMIIMLATQFL